MILNAKYYISDSEALRALSYSNGCYFNAEKEMEMNRPHEQL
jgi:hypothetical protein